jgi:hypothetical protein
MPIFPRFERIRGPENGREGHEDREKDHEQHTLRLDSRHAPGLVKQRAAGNAAQQQQFRAQQGRNRQQEGADRQSRPAWSRGGKYGPQRPKAHAERGYRFHAGKRPVYEIRVQGGQENRQDRQ